MRHNPNLGKSHAIYTIVVIGFIATVHSALPIYFNSSFLSIFASEKTVGLIYMLGSALTIFGFLFIPVLLRKAGNYLTALWLIVIQICLFYGLTVSTNPLTITAIFISQMMIIGLIGFCLDVFLQRYSNIHSVGFVRGLYLTTQNSAWVITPLIGTLIIGSSNDYRGVYVAALFMLFPLLYLVYKNFPRFKDPHYHHPSFLKSLTHAVSHKDHRKIFLANIILQTFYAWMIVYSPLYLHNVVGFNWSEIGIILTIMLLPFPLIQWPLGKIADKKYGEKEIMTIGFSLMGLSTIALALISSTNLWIWAFVLLLTRIGAASVEVMMETYFFKTVDQKDSSVLGFFRITRPISYFIAPMITGVTLLFTRDPSVTFVVLGLFCLTAMIPAWRLKDTN